MDFVERYLRWHARYTHNRMLNLLALVEKTTSEKYAAIGAEYNTLVGELAEMVKEVDNG